MRDKIEALKLRFREAKTEEEFALIDREIDALAEQDKNEFSNAVVEAAKETAEDALRDKLEGILPAISVSYIAKKYFKKTPMWFYQRLNGNIVNGKKAHFTEKELETLSEAMLEISEQLKTAAFVF